MPENARVNSCLGHDLRLPQFVHFREEVYRHLPFRMEQSYFDKQAMLGLNFERLYE